MPDRRSVDELSIEELERILAIRKRQARQQQLERMKASGRVIPSQTAQADISAFLFKDASDLPATTSEATRSAAQAARPYFEDDVAGALPTRQRQDQSIWRTFVDRSLLLVEIAAVIGLIVLGAAFLDGISTLQRQTAEAQASAEEQIRAAIPTIAPTPQLQLASIVLPGGHTPPNQAGGGQFNFDEIPPNLRALVRDQVFLPPEIERPRPLPEGPRRIIIPQINVDQVIVPGTDWEALKLGVGQHLNGATPADPDRNVVLAAHNDIYGEIFRHLDRLEPGMQFQIQTESRFYTYVVRETRIVKPNDVYVMEDQGVPMVTLISCYPYQVNTQRIIVFADRVDT